MSSIHGHSCWDPALQSEGQRVGATLLIPKGASPLTPCSFPFYCLYQGAKKEDEFCWSVALMVVKEPAQVSVLSQLHQPRTEMFTLPGIPTTPTSPPPNSLKTPGSFSGILFFIFIAVWKKQMFTDCYFTMHVVSFPPSLKASAKACICCSVFQFPCFKVTHSKNFARALRWRCVPQT